MLVQPAMTALAAEPSPVGMDPAVGPGTRAVIAGLLVLTAMRVDLFSGITLGTVAGLALAPVWVPRIRGFSGGPGFAAVVTLCIASGIWLTALASADHTIIVR